MVSLSFRASVVSNCKELAAPNMGSIQPGMHQRAKSRKLKSVNRYNLEINVYGC